MFWHASDRDLVKRRYSLYAKCEVVWLGTFVGVRGVYNVGLKL